MREGVFGPWLLLAAESDSALFYGERGLLVEKRPIGAGEVRVTARAFLVWVGQFVAVVSPGVAPNQFADVAGAVRRHFARPDVPVVFGVERVAEDHVRVASDNAAHVSRSDLARAEAYVLVQCAWVESPTISVEVDGELLELSSRFDPKPDGTFHPVIEDRRPG